MAESNETMRIGIFGGSFNPIHLGHIGVAERAASEHGLSKVLVVPALFVIFQSLQERFRPMTFEGEEENPDVASEIAQYGHRPVDYELEK